MPARVHALLGENGAGKSTLVKCIMGFYQPTRGQVMIDGHEVDIPNPRVAHAHGIGMVYQHFTLVPSLTAAENLVISRAHPPAVIHWRDEMPALEAFLERMPFKVPLDVPVSGLSAGEKQKLEILKQLYLDQHFLILDEPTSVLTPGEADEVLGLLRGMAEAGDLTILMISHKFREVTAFADEVSVLRHGKYIGGGKVADHKRRRNEPHDDRRHQDPRARRARSRWPTSRRWCSNSPACSPTTIRACRRWRRSTSRSMPARSSASPGCRATASRNWSRCFPASARRTSGRIFIRGAPFEPTRDHMDRFKVFSLQEEPLRNAAVRRMTVAENISFRTFDKPPITTLGWWLSPGPMRARARELIAAYRVKTPSTEEFMENLSGGNVQRAVLARELSSPVEVLVVANPCFGLDFASVAEIRSQIMEQRNRGAAVLLVSEDLDEILELADRIAVMSGGKIDYVVAAADADRTSIGRAMAGH